MYLNNIDKISTCARACVLNKELVRSSIFLRRPKGRRSNIALDLQFMQIFTNQKYS